jgi:hypothetical protein
MKEEKQNPISGGDAMKARVSLFVLFALVAGYVALSLPATAQAQSFSGKWVHRGPKGLSVFEFFPGEKHAVGPTRGAFRHSIVLDDGRMIEGMGHYVFRSVGPNRGWLTLHFADGHVTREHEHTIGAVAMNVRHHGVTRTYVRQ